MDFDISGITNVLDNLVKGLNSTVDKALKNMKPEDAEAFNKAFKENNIPSKLENIKKEYSSIKKDFNID